jgi:hypothetical protein
MSPVYLHGPFTKNKQQFRKLFPDRISKQHVFLKFKKKGGNSIFIYKHSSAIPQIVTGGNTANPVHFIT